MTAVGARIQPLGRAEAACSPETPAEPSPPAKPPDGLVLDQRALNGVSEFLGKGYEGWEYYAGPRGILKPRFDLSELSLV